MYFICLLILHLVTVLVNMMLLQSVSFPLSDSQFTVLTFKCSFPHFLIKHRHENQHFLYFKVYLMPWNIDRHSGIKCKVFTSHKLFSNSLWTHTTENSSFVVLWGIPIIFRTLHPLLIWRKTLCINGLGCSPAHKCHTSLDPNENVLLNTVCWHS